MKRKSKETEYCRQTLEPLFGAIAHIQNLRYRHGNMEFGKDFTFSYLNPLNQKVNVGIQAKYGDIVGTVSKLMTEIVSQIQTAFTVHYKNKPRGQKLYLNELYIVCSGKYRKNAITLIDEALEKNFNVFFLDGSDIKHLQMKFTQRREKEKSETKRALNALLIELNQNIQMAKGIDSKMEEYIQKEMHFLIDFRLNCLQKVLELDIDDKWILDEAAIQWHNLTIDNNLLNRIRIGIISKDDLKNLKIKLWNIITQDIKKLENFRNYVTSYISSLQ